MAIQFDVPKSATTFEVVTLPGRRFNVELTDDLTVQAVKEAIEDLGLFGPFKLAFKGKNLKKGTMKDAGVVPGSAVAIIVKLNPCCCVIQ